MSFTVTTQMYTLTCRTCGMLFAMSDKEDDRFRESHDTFYCPRKHPNYYPGKSKTEKLKEKLKVAEQREDRALREITAKTQQLQKEKRKHAATKGHRTREKRKAAHGVCPVGNCGRTFANLQRHIDGQHPKYAKAHKK